MPRHAELDQLDHVGLTAVHSEMRPRQSVTIELESAPHPHPQRRCGTVQWCAS